MIDLAKHRINITCEKCHFKNSATLNQVKANAIIICSGCKINIRFIDHLFSTRKSLKSVRLEINSLMNEFNKIGNINFRF